MNIRDERYCSTKFIINVLGSSMQNTTVIFMVRFYLSSPPAEMVRFLTDKSHKAGSRRSLA